MAHEIRTDDPRGFNKGRSSTYAEHPAVPEFDKHLKKAGGHVEDNSPKNLSEWHKRLKEGFTNPTCIDRRFTIQMIGRQQVTKNVSVRKFITEDLGMSGK